MSNPDVFVSVGVTATDQQEKFVRAVEERLRSEGLTPHTIGRNTFTSNAPLKKICELMESCAGVVVIALERTHIASGTEKRGGPNETTLTNIKIPTPWNQIEAAMAYTRGLPLMVIAENGIKSEGLLEKGHDWYVQWVPVELAVLSSTEFNGVLSDWKQKILNKTNTRIPAKSGSELTIGELIKGLKPAQLWSVIVALVTLVGGAFAAGAKFL